jgi:beta-N-acetylhexosaminidase
MAEVGKTDNPAKAEEVGRKIGFYLKKIGFNYDFAPEHHRKAS